MSDLLALGAGTLMFLLTLGLVALFARLGEEGS